MDLLRYMVLVGSHVSDSEAASIFGSIKLHAVGRPFCHCWGTGEFAVIPSA